MFFGYVLRRGELLWNKATVFYLEELQLNQRFVRIMGPFKKDIGVFFFELFLRDLEGTEPAMADVFIYIYIFIYFLWCFIRVQCNAIMQILEIQENLLFFCSYFPTR